MPPSGCEGLAAAPLPPSWSPAFRLIVALLRGESPGDLAASVDRESFGQALRRHRVALALPVAAQTALCPALRETLALRQRQMMMVAMERAAQLGAVVSGLNGAIIGVCALKGPAFAALFGDPFGREASDLDLLVAAAEFTRAIERLGALGYHPDRAGAIDHAIALRHPRFAAPLELHRRLASPDGLFPIDRFDPWVRLSAVPVAGGLVATLDREAAVVYAAFHGTKHNWHRLFWLVDIARVLARDDVDWPAVLALARHLGVERQVMMAVLLAERVLGAALPPGLEAQPSLVALGGRLAGDLVPHLDDLPSDRGAELAGRMGLWPTLARLFALYPLWRARIGLLGFLLGASDKDHAFLRLPPALAWAYPLVRVLRLLSHPLGRTRTKPTR
ncbi:nucleotidyltransferase domain-containing protein [Rhodospirillum rubrum]|uniref:nucleotidyltransferase domain-containing protein n=1 Tax=Rhodospirillum rubrum TaxID=1085 RepID=UPI0027DD0CE2|nr:nucleotidyltransferase family protein [Rhodospirillum rubrum]